MSRAKGYTSIDELRNFIRETLKETFGGGKGVPGNHLDIITDEASMKEYWVKAFTHRSIDVTNNYEILEFYGDNTIAYAFSEYIRKRFGNKVTQYTGTLLFSKYASKTFQAELSNDLNLSKYVRYNPEILPNNENVSEDILEAFFGALTLSCNDRIHLGLGIMYSYNFLVKIYDTKSIDIDKLKQDPKTQLKEIIDALGGNQPVYEKIQERSTSGLTVVRTTIFDKEFECQGRNLRVAESCAAEKILKYLEDQGINETEARKIRLERKAKSQGKEYDETRIEEPLKIYKELLMENRSIHPSSDVTYKITFISDKSRGDKSKKSKGIPMLTTASIIVSYTDINKQVVQNSVATGSGNDQATAATNAIDNFRLNYLGTV